MGNEEGVVVPREELSETWQFQASLSNHPIVRFPDGHLRYKQTIADKYERDMNELWREYRRGEHTREWMMQYYRDIGYSLGGYEEIWGGELDSMQREIAYERPIGEIEKEWASTDLKASCIVLAKELAEAEGIDIEDSKIIPLIELLRLIAKRL